MVKTLYCNLNNFVFSSNHNYILLDSFSSFFIELILIINVSSILVNTVNSFYTINKFNQQDLLFRKLTSFQKLNYFRIINRAFINRFFFCYSHFNLLLRFSHSLNYVKRRIMETFYAVIFRSSSFFLVSDRFFSWFGFCIEIFLFSKLFINLFFSYVQKLFNDDLFKSF